MIERAHKPATTPKNASAESAPSANASAMMGRRRALLALSSTMLLAGCETIGDLFEPMEKAKFPGKRESIGILDQGALLPDRGVASVQLPAPVMHRDWPQAGGTPAHVLGNEAGGELKQLWSSNIGEGGGYRKRLTAQPVMAQGRVFAMDSNGLVSAFDIKTGASVWQTDTQKEDDLSVNIGGGLGFDGGALYVATGRAELMRVDAASGKIGWRIGLKSPARSAPTIAGGQIYLVTLDQRLIAFDLRGKQLWEYRVQSSDTTTDVLGVAAPAVAGSLVVAGFASGDLVVLQADSGSVAWTDMLSSAHGDDSMLDVASITALPIVDDRTLYVAGLGGMMAAYDLPTGRRLWERSITVGDTPSLSGDWLFALDTSQTLAAISKADGRIAWVSTLNRWEEPDKRRHPISWHGPVLANGKVLVAGSLNNMVAINAADGSRAGIFDLPGVASMPPVLVDGMCFVVTDDGSLTAFR
jgi:outer membrane protein assembly factor BamB